MSDKFGLVDALAAKYEGDIKSAQANIKVYLDNPAGIGEHPDIVGALDMEVQKLADATEKLATANSLRGSPGPTMLNENICKC